MDRREDTQEWQDEQFADLERELKQALRRVEPPAGFADRVIGRAAGREQKRGKVLVMPVRWRPWVSGAIAATLAIGVFTAQEIRVHQEKVEQQRKAELAKQQFETALQITNETLSDVRQQIRQAGIPSGD